MKTIALLLSLMAMPLAAVSAETAGPLFPGAQGYGGPEFTLMECSGELTIWGGGDVSFRLDERWSLGIAVSYPESIDIGGVEFLLAGVRAEADIARWGWFGLCATATASGGFLGSEGRGAFALYLEAELLASFRILPGMVLRLGPGYRAGFPMAADDGFPQLGFAELSSPTFFFQLCDTGGRIEASLVPEIGLRLAGFYDATFLPLFDQILYLDGGGTQAVIGKSFLIGPCGGISRGPIQVGGSTFGMAFTGARAEYVAADFGFAALSVETTIGAAFTGLVDPVSGDSTGGPTFFARPMARIALMPVSFFGVTLGVGYNVFLGSSMAGITDADLHSLAFSVGIRNR